MRDIGTKYHTTGDIIRKADNTPLPPDEPLVLLRARDRYVPQTLEYYLGLRTKDGQALNEQADLQATIDRIKQWQHDHPEKLKTPHDPR